MMSATLGKYGCREVSGASSPANTGQDIAVTRVATAAMCFIFMAPYGDTFSCTNVVYAQLPGHRQGARLSVRSLAQIPSRSRRRSADNSSFSRACEAMKIVASVAMLVEAEPFHATL